MEARNGLYRTALGAAAFARSQAVLSSSLCLAFALGLLVASGKPSHADDGVWRFDSSERGGREVTDLAAFSGGSRSTQVGATFDDVKFSQNAYPILPLSSKLSVRFKDGVLALLARSGTSSTFNAGPTSETVIWEGLIGKAQFVLQTVGGTNTLHDSDGNMIWSDAQEVSQADLRLNRDSTGKAELTDRQGATLWSGSLKSPVVGERSYSATSDQFTIKMSGLVIKGDKHSAEITTIDGARIWSGTLPSRPTILVTDQKEYLRIGPYASEGGSDRKVRFQFVSAPGEVTIVNEDHATLGTRPVPILRMDTESLSMLPDAAANSVRLPAEYFMPRPELNVDGIIYVTYRDTAGGIVRRLRAYKGRNAYGYTSVKS